MTNQAFIDGQNLYLSTTHSAEPWKVDLFRFRKYLERKYDVSEAYYFLGCIDEKLEDMYDNIQKAGFIIIFRKHDGKLTSTKKGNIDTDLVFSVMKRLYKGQIGDGKIFLVSGDGDYYRLVEFLIEENKFGKILLPSKTNASSLYKLIKAKYRDYLDSEAIREKIELKKRDLLR